MAAKLKIYGYLAVMKLGQILGYDCTVNDAAKRVFLIAQGHADENGAAFPSVSKIAKSLCKTRQAVTKQIKILEDHGYLIRREKYGPHGGRKANTIMFNIELAQQLYAQPDIFCKRNVTAMVIYLVTLLRYGGLQPLALAGDETIGGYKKKTREEIISERNKLKKTEDAFKKACVAAGAWEQEKELEAKTGITKEHKSSLDALNEELRQFLGPMQLVNFDIETNKQIKGLEPLVAVAKKTELFKQKLEEVRAVSLNSPANIQASQSA